MKAAKRLAIKNGRELDKDDLDLLFGSMSKQELCGYGNISNELPKYDPARGVTEVSQLSSLSSISAL
jgi:hypothetical protein